MKAHPTLRPAIPFLGFLSLALFAILCFPLMAQEGFDLEVQGKTYRAAKLAHVLPDRVGITHSSGVGTILLEKLTEEQIALLNMTSSSVAIPPDWKSRLEILIQQRVASMEARQKAIAEAVARQQIAAQNASAQAGTQAAQTGTQAAQTDAQAGMGASDLSATAGNAESASTSAATESMAAESKADATPASTGLKLPACWSEPYGGKARVQDELRELFGNVQQGRPDSKPHPELVLVPGITYLMPYKKALEKLGNGAVVAVGEVATPGFPSRSLREVVVDGSFGDGFERTILVTDFAGQVVSVQFISINQDARGRGSASEVARAQTHVPLRGGWKTFNLIDNNASTDTSDRVMMGIATVSGKTPNLYQVESQFYDTSGRLRRRVRWFVPQPIVDLVYYTAGLKGSGLTTGGLTTGTLSTP